MKANPHSSQEEFHQPPNISPLSDHAYHVAPEITPPAPEFPDLPDSHQEQSGYGDNQAQSHPDKMRKKQRIEQANHNFLVRMMSYAVAAVVSVVILSTTLYNEEIVDNVIAAGGSVDGDFRFTIQWNDVEANQNDFDAHCLEPGGYEIYFECQGIDSPNGGMLDVDIVTPGEKVAIENIIYEDKATMENGVYELSVVCFSNMGYDGGFRAQIELNGRTYNLEYSQPMYDGERVVVATVEKVGGRFILTKSIDDKPAW